MSNVGQNMRFRAAIHRQRTVTGILAHRLVEIARRMSHAAADQQRDRLRRRQTAGGVDGWDHGVAGQHYHVHLRQRGQRRQIVLRQPGADLVSRRQRRCRQRRKLFCHSVSLIPSQPSGEDAFAIINAACREA